MAKRIISDMNGKTSTVDGTPFKMEINGKTYEFFVHMDGCWFYISERRTGRRLGQVPFITRSDFGKDRKGAGIETVRQLIEKHGAARVAVVIDSAPAHTGA